MAPVMTLKTNDCEFVSAQIDLVRIGSQVEIVITTVIAAQSDGIPSEDRQDWRRAEQPAGRERHRFDQSVFAEAR